MSPRVGTNDGARIEHIEVSAYTIPTDRPESDGTFAWTTTTLIVVEIQADGLRGLGYTYGSRAVAELIRSDLAPELEGGSALNVRAQWVEMTKRLRNIGRRDIGMMAIAAIDTALWDLKARTLEIPLVALLGEVRPSVPAYGSGGFTSYSDATLAQQFGAWGLMGITKFKMKVGRDADRDGDRVRHARGVIGPGADLFVDANGAYSPKQAIELAEVFARSEVTWFEEPVSGDDRGAMKVVRDRFPPGMELAAGEYISTLDDARLLLEAGAVDVLMPDVTRCGGVTGLLDIAALARTYRVPLSLHTAPALHLHAACAIPEVRHLEYFHDHARIENMLFEGAAAPIDGHLSPDLSHAGHGLTFRRREAESYAT